MDKLTYRSLRRVVAYLVHDEAKHWHESGCPDDHIYRDVLALQRWMIDRKLRRV